MHIGDKIVALAEEFEGLVEIRQNRLWDDLRTSGSDPRAKAFAEILKRAGHQDGWAYCMSFCEGIWVEAYRQAKARPATIARIKTLLSPSVMESYTACREAGLASKQAVRGAIGFMQSGDSWRGHAFLVTELDGIYVRTIEANTSPGPGVDEREAGPGLGGVWRKRRLVDYTRRDSGLHLRGFLAPLQDA